MTNTPSRTIEVQALGSPESRAEAIRQQTDKILDRLHKLEEVHQARQDQDSASGRLTQLRSTHTRLMRTIQEYSERSRESMDQAKRLLIGDESGNWAAVAEQSARFENERRVAVQAGQWLVERLLPEAEIDEMRRTAAYRLAQAAALRVEAATRMERTAKLMSEAAEFEGTIAFDPAETLSGALTARAEEFEHQADQYRRWAAERADRHQRLMNELNTAAVR